MVDPSPSLFAAYNLAVGLVTGLGVVYFLYLKPAVVEYRQFHLATIAGLLLFLIGGPVAELLLPALVHWVHGTAASLVILGLYNPLESELRRDVWTDVLLREPS
ncbi:hypothetical protein [Halomontanus rarus]|uniref:hypothetical protein n=1 Tax=Halomontanus rarus TaxID=3034020 RepID=UPI0023E8B3B8|nr:hypothetical protein [Halovivax sp. TS33]